MITLTATTEYKIFTDGDGCEDNDADSIKNEAKCTAAARAVGIDKTATADGGTSGDAPPWCYVTKDGDLMFNEDKNTGECTADNTCICSKCAAGGGSVAVDLPEGKFTKIAEIPKNASGVKITVQSPEKKYEIFQSLFRCEANTDTFSIKTKEECTVAAKALGIDQTATPDGHTSGVNDDPPYCYVKDGELMFNAEGKNTGRCTADDKCICWKFDGSKAGGDLDVMLMEEDELPCLPAANFTAAQTNDCTENMLLDKWGDPDPNYPKCLAGFHCKTDPDGIAHPTPKEVTEELNGMTIYFSGDDTEVPVTETVELRTPNDKTTEKLSLWVYAFPPTKCNANNCVVPSADGTWSASSTVAENTISGHNAGKCIAGSGDFCPKAVVKFTGTVTYSYDCVELVSD